MIRELFVMISGKVFIWSIRRWLKEVLNGGVERGLRCQIRFGSRTLSELADGGDALLGNAKDEFEVLEQLACCVGIHARNGFWSNSQTASARKSGQICQDAKAEKKTSVVSQRTVFLLFVR